MASHNKLETSSPANEDLAFGLASPRAARVMPPPVVLGIDPDCTAPSPPATPKGVTTTGPGYDAKSHLVSDLSPNAAAYTMANTNQPTSRTEFSNVIPAMHIPSSTGTTSRVVGLLPRRPPSAHLVSDTISTGIDRPSSPLIYAAFHGTVHSPDPITAAVPYAMGPLPPDRETILNAFRWFRRTRRLASATQMLTALSDCVDIGRSAKEFSEGLASGDRVKMVINASTIALKLLSIPLVTSKTFYDLRPERLHLNMGNADPGLPTIEPTPLYLRCLVH